MPFVGADIAALRGFAAALRHRRAELDATRDHLTAVLAGLHWVGPDRERFMLDWQHTHAPGLATLATELAEAAHRAGVHAERQEQAARRWS